MIKEISIVEHPVAHEIADVIRESYRLRKLEHELSDIPIQPVIQYLENENETIEIRTTPKNKPLEEVRNQIEETTKKWCEILLTIPGRYINPSLEFRMEGFFYHAFHFQVEDIHSAHYYFCKGIRMVRGEKDIAELEITGKDDDWPILHLPEGWALGIQSMEHERHRSGKGIVWSGGFGFDEMDDTVVERVNLFWRPKLPSSPRFLIPDPKISKQELIDKNSRLDSMAPEELQEIPKRIFDTNVFYNDSLDITNEINKE